MLAWPTAHDASIVRPAAASSTVAAQFDKPGGRVPGRPVAHAHDVGKVARDGSGESLGHPCQ